MHSVGLLGAPVDANSSHLRGCADGPAAVREALHSGSANWCAEDGTDVRDLLLDLGDVDVENTTGSTSDRDLITSTVGDAVSRGLLPLTIGGDHSVTYPILRAVGGLHEHLTVVHVDAHPDLYDDFGGNPLSHASPFARAMEDGLCSRLVQIGIRTATPHQREQAARFGVQTVEARSFSSFDPTSIEGPTYLTIDLDGLDPAFAPGVSHHEPGGLSTRQVLDLVAAIRAPIVGADVVELNPVRDVQGMTAMVAAKLVRELAAAMARPR